MLVAGFYLVALSGLPGTLLVAAMLNLVVALLTFGIVVRARRGGAPAAAPVERRENATRADSRLDPETLRRLLVFTSFGTAIASFIYEIDWIRMLSLVLGSATHSFELMLSAFILGLALGALWIRGRIDRLRHPVRTLGHVQWAMGLLALATLPVYVASFDWMVALMRTFARTDAGLHRVHHGPLRDLSPRDAAGDLLRRHDPPAHHPHLDPAAGSASARSARCTPGTRSAPSSA